MVVNYDTSDSEESEQSDIDEYYKARPETSRTDQSALVPHQEGALASQPEGTLVNPGAAAEGAIAQQLVNAAAASNPSQVVFEKGVTTVHQGPSIIINGGPGVSITLPPGPDVLDTERRAEEERQRRRDSILESVTSDIRDYYHYSLLVPFPLPWIQDTGEENFCVELIIKHIQGSKDIR